MADKHTIRPQFIIDRCVTLKSNWSTRTKKFKDWYNILLLNNELEQEGMESVVTNDPRTGFNLARHLLTTMVISDRIPIDTLPPEFVPATSYLEDYVSRRWKDQEKRYRMIGRQSWLFDFVSWLLATGWYSIFSMVTDKEIWSEVWSPANSFPGFGPDGLVEHAHIYTLSPVASAKKLKVMGWTYPRPITGDITMYDYWAFDADANVTNSVVMESLFVKEPVVDKALTKLGTLPIFTSPAGGLPDMGSIKTGKVWQEHYGEAFVGTDEDLLLNYNKMRSFMQQAARTAAQPHWLELSSGDTPIATEELMDRWGSILHGGQGDSVTPLQSNPIPVELTNILFHYQNELQRGMFPAAVFGNVQQQISYLALANIATASMQTLTPYRDSTAGMRTDLNNYWIDMILMNRFRPHGFKLPENMPERLDRRFEVDADVEIPGLLVQKANIARIMNPKFRLPVTWITDRMFPEIKNALKSIADTRAEDAMMDPDAIKVSAIIGYREQARLFREANDIPTAELYEKLAKKKEAELELAQQPQVQPPGGNGASPIEQELSRELGAAVTPPGGATNA
ncbi:hypothetical protein LCGC14_0383090 [marine sediment metagenome]|uniref:Uncharacterized protein n=1 Tax=marine sediment metagenome TaxID=412755 RepID=A0A0F9T1I3_9ZZZZ